MSETPPEGAPAQEQPDQPTPEAKPDETDWKAEARKWEARSKENSTKVRELDQQRRAVMTDAERAVTEAEERGRTAAVSEFGRELAQERFDALAGRRNPDFDTARALEFVDLGKFLGDDGRPDAAAIKAAVERLVPEPAGGPPSFDGGSRKSADPVGDMNSIIRKAAGLG